MQRSLGGCPPRRRSVRTSVGVGRAIPRSRARRATSSPGRIVSRRQGSAHAEQERPPQNTTSARYTETSRADAIKLTPVGADAPPMLYGSLVNETQPKMMSMRTEAEIPFFRSCGKGVSTLLISRLDARTRGLVPPRCLHPAPKPCVLAAGSLW